MFTSKSLVQVLQLKVLLAYLIIAHTVVARGLVVLSHDLVCGVWGGVGGGVCVEAVCG